MASAASGSGAVPSNVEPDIWTDGTRLLRLAIVETGCNVGTDLRRNYSVGGLQAVGTQFAAVGCPQLPDTRGWFAALRQFNANFVFYVYTDPISAMDGSTPDELQAILDTVQFVPRPDSGVRYHETNVWQSYVEIASHLNRVVRPLRVARPKAERQFTDA